jgi:hypothetical protein
VRCLFVIVSGILGLVSILNGATARSPDRRNAAQNCCLKSLIYFAHHFCDKGSGGSKRRGQAVPVTEKRGGARRLGGRDRLS